MNENGEKGSKNQREGELAEPQKKCFFKGKREREEWDKLCM